MSTDADETILMFKAGVDEMTGLDDRFCRHAGMKISDTLLGNFLAVHFGLTFLSDFLFKVFLLLT